jgi:hypothetical protein
LAADLRRGADRLGGRSVSLSQPEVIYVGTGEDLHRPNLSAGGDILKSKLFHCHRHQRRVVIERLIVGEMLNAGENGVDQLGKRRVLVMG